MTAVRSPLMAFPLIRLVVGLSAGFVGTFAVVWLIDVLDQSGDVVAFETTVGDPDIGAYCAAKGLTAREIGDVAPTWVCVGSTDGFWASEQVDVEAVCAAQFPGSRASGSASGGWRCVSPFSRG